FAVLRSLHPDIFLASHGSFFNLAEKSKRRDFVDPQGYAAFVERSERAIERQIAAETIVIHDVTVIDGTGAPPRPHADVVVEAGRIAQIGDVASVAHPAGARVIDGAGKFLIPGLIDMHAHIAGDVLNEKGEPSDRWDRDVALVFLRVLRRFRGMTI